MSNSSILIVEDDKINSQMIIEYVSSMGYRVSGVADNYNKALESVKNDAPDLILMDIILKGSKDGVSISNAIRASYDIPIIYLTGYADDEIIDRAKHTNPYGYIVKPFKYDDLKASIKIALSKHKSYKQNYKFNEAYETAFNNLKCGIITTDKSGKILFMNHIAELFTGFELEEAISDEINKVLIFDNGFMNTERLIDEVISHGFVHYALSNLMICNKNGSVIPVKINAGCDINDNKSLISFLVWENIETSSKPSVSNYDKYKNIDHKAYKVNIMLACESTVIRDGLLNSLEKEEKIEICCKACTKLEYLECFYCNEIDLVILNDELPHTNEIVDKIDFLKNIDSEVKILVLSKNFNKVKEQLLIEKGVKGFMNISKNYINVPIAIYSIQNGDLWFRRKILNVFIEKYIRFINLNNSNLVLLTDKERKIYDLINKGYKNKEIADSLRVSEKTVKNHINNIYKKLGIDIRKKTTNK